MTTDQGNPFAALVAEGLSRLTEAAETMQFRATAGAALGAALDLDDERLVDVLSGLDREQLRKVFAAATAVGVATTRALDDDRHEPTTDEAVRGVQAWMALDLHQALNLPTDHRAEVTHQGRRSWGDWWAELLAVVRQTRERAVQVEQLAAELDRDRHAERRRAEQAEDEFREHRTRADQAEELLGEAHTTSNKAERERAQAERSAAGWKADAKRYAGNADYWRKRAEEGERNADIERQAAAALQQQRDAAREDARRIAVDLDNAHDQTRRHRERAEQAERELAETRTAHETGVERFLRNLGTVDGRAIRAEAALQRAHDTHRQACPGMYACPMCAALAPVAENPGHSTPPPGE